MSDQYLKRGVSSDKKEVHQAIQKIDRGLFPHAFCKIIPDTQGDDQFCQIIHADGAGTKSSLAYIYWRETGDISVWKGIAQDAIVMNTDDLLCVGATNQLIISSTIGRNKQLIPAEVIKTIIEGTEEFLEKIRSWGIDIVSGGGETADVGDLVKTVIVDSTIATRIKKEYIINNAHIQPGDVIIGLGSSGKTTYETAYTSGIGSNGLTLARHELFSTTYATMYPESFDSQLPAEAVYQGAYKVTDQLEGLDLSIGQLCLSPTRTYLPVMAALLDTYRYAIHGVIHCTGGGQTKILHFIDQLHIVKNNLLEVPLIFKLIQSTNAIPWKEMYEVFNMGHRLELYVPENMAEKIISIIHQFELEAQIIGHVESHPRKQLTIRSGYGEYVYV